MRPWARPVLVGLAAVLVARARHRPRRERDERKLLTLEGDYSLATMRERGLEHIVTARDLAGFFTHVWSVYPFLGADPDDLQNASAGSPSSTAVGSRHTLVEGTVAFRRWLRGVPILNFLLAQGALLLKLNRIMSEERIGIVRASEPFYLGLIGILLARCNRVPLVVRLIANYDVHFWATGQPVYPRLFRRPSLERRIAQFVLSRADLVAAGNEDIRRFAIAHGAREDKTTVFLVGGLIDPGHFEVEPGKRRPVRDELGLGDRPVLICVSRLEAVKHPEDVVRVLARVRDQIPDVAAVLVGDGSLRGDLEKIARDLSVADALVLTGNRTQAWISSALACASVVLCPVAGRALVEAALSGTPIVAYDIDWHSELIRSGETGMLVTYRDVDEMAAAVVELLSHHPRAAMLGAAARAFALQSMDPDRLVRQERAAYLRLLARCARDNRDGKSRQTTPRRASP